MAGRQIVVDIVGDASKFTKATKEATGSAQKLGSLFGSGLGMGAGISAFNLASDAISRTTDYLVDSVAKAKAEEVGIARLGASLKANVPGWNGNTDAIEKNIAAMVRSTGFSDGDMRDSLAALVGATHDVTKAQTLQATAMDLARFKGIDLVTASKALIKVEGGQYRALKELGIVLKTGATQTEALAAVQKVAGGQMAAYMETAAGKSEVMQNRLEDLQETVGQRLTPALTTGTEAVLGLMDALDSEVPIDTGDRLKGISDALNIINPAMWTANLTAGEWGKVQAAAADQASAAAAKTAMAWDTGSERIGAAFDDMSSASTDAKDKIVSNARRERMSYADLASYLLGKYNTDFDKAMGIQDARAELSRIRHEAADDKKERSSGDLTDKEKREADKRAVIRDQESADQYAKLQELGALSSKDYAAWVAALERLAKGTKGKVHDAYMAAIADIRALRGAAANPINIKVNYKSSKPGQAPVPRAAGGSASGLTWVGEQGPELVDLPTGSFVHNATASRRMASAGGSPINVYVDTPLFTPGAAEALAAAIVPHVTRSMQRQQLIPRR